MGRPGNRSHIQKYPEIASPSFGRVGTDNDVLQMMQDASARAFDFFTNSSYQNGVPTNIVKEDYNANLKEAIRVDPTNGVITIKLPELTDEMVGGQIFISNISSSLNTITISPSKEDTIDGYDNYTLTGPYNNVMLWAAKKELWLASRNLYIPGNVIATNAYFSDTLRVTEDGYFSGLVDITGGCYIGASCYISDDFEAIKDGYIGGNLALMSDGYVYGLLDIAGGCYVNSNLDVDGSADIAGDIDGHGDLTVTGDISGNGWGSASYSTSNVSTDRSLDADSTTLDEVADVLGTLIADLKTLGLIS